MDENKIEFMKIDFGVLELKPKDILVLRTEVYLPVEVQVQIQKQIKKYLSREILIIFLDGNSEIGIVRSIDKV